MTDRPSGEISGAAFVYNRMPGGGTIDRARRGGGFSPEGIRNHKTPADVANTPATIHAVQPCTRRSGAGHGEGRPFFELPPRVADIAKALLWVSRQAAREQASHVGWRCTWQSGPVWFGAQHGSDDLRCGLAGKECAADEHFVEHDAKRPNVRALVDRPDLSPARGSYTPPYPAPCPVGWRQRPPW